MDIFLTLPVFNLLSNFDGCPREVDVSGTGRSLDCGSPLPLWGMSRRRGAELGGGRLSRGGKSSPLRTTRCAAVRKRQRAAALQMRIPRNDDSRRAPPRELLSIPHSGLRGFFCWKGKWL